MAERMQVDDEEALNNLALPETDRAASASAAQADGEPAADESELAFVQRTELANAESASELKEVYILDAE